MSTRIRELAVFVSIWSALAALLCGAAPVAAQAKDGALQQQLVGAWTLQEVVLEQGGNRREPFGPKPKGFASFDANGNFYYLVLRADLPKVASNNREKPTADEAWALATGVLGMYGKYSISETDGSLLLRVDASTYPNWNGSEQKRLIVISDDEVRVINPTPPVGGGTAYLVWKRAR